MIRTMTTPAADPAATFEPHRPMLTSLAYRMLGSLADAEDVVQTAYLRWHGADRAAVQNPPAFLRTTVTRLCLDHLDAAKARREQYVGPWLPDPLVDRTLPASDGADDLAADLSTALLLTLERLSPLERAAFLLHDVFAVDFPEIARALDRSEAACRQLASRARDHVRASRPRFRPTPDQQRQVADAFLAAARDGNVAALTALLAEHAAFHTDTGGKAKAALNVIRGRDKIIRLLAALAPTLRPFVVRPVAINATPGYVLDDPTDGRLKTLSFDFDEAGRITAIYSTANPDKLRDLR
jgi:RNA polymerase sigma-70 factor (ECF subfamily)